MKARFRKAPIAQILAFPTQAIAQYDDLSGAEKTEESSTTSSGGNRFGRGIEALITGLFAGAQLTVGLPIGAGGGASFIFDATQFRIEGILGMLFIEDVATAFGIGARFLWVVHSTSRSDLGVGAGIGVSHRENDGPGDATA